MKKFIISFWKYKNDQWDDIEKIVEAKSFDEAYLEFRKNYPTQKIRGINELI